MPESPSTYKKRYLPISYDGCNGRKHIFLTKYRSSFSGNEFRKHAFYDLRNFIRKSGRFEEGKNGANHIWTSSGWMFSPLLKPLPWVYIDLSILQPMFQGVGRPKDWGNALRAVDVYLETVEMSSHQLKLMGWQYVSRDRQDYANWYFGLDCRGFVGAYLREIYPHIKDTAKDMSFSIDSYNKAPGNFHTSKKGGSFTRIDDPREVRQCDLLVKCNSGDGKRHVALIDQVGIATSMSVMVKTAESRGGVGLCHKYDELRRLNKSHKSGQNDRNWKHSGAHYNFVLRPKL